MLNAEQDEASGFRGLRSHCWGRRDDSVAKRSCCAHSSVLSTHTVQLTRWLVTPGPLNPVRLFRQFAGTTIQTAGLCLKSMLKKIPLQANRAEDMAPKNSYFESLRTQVNLQNAPCLKEEGKKQERVPISQGKVSLPNEKCYSYRQQVLGFSSVIRRLSFSSMGKIHQLRTFGLCNK